MIEKYQNGETQRDYFRRIRGERRVGISSVKAELRVRDGIGCRWPDCQWWKRGYRVDGVHLDDMGMGGDKKLARTQRQRMIRLCVKHHMGPDSLHSGDRRVVTLTDRGTDGPCQFERRHLKSNGGWQVDGVEDEFTFTARRNLAAAESEDDL